MPAIIRESTCNSLPTASPWLMRAGRTGLIIYGYSHWTVLRDIRLQTSSQSKSGHSACHPMERVSLFCAATMILTLFSSKNPSHERAVPGYLSLWKNGDPDIPILKQAEYAKLQYTSGR